jgi:glycine cleavage system H protein
VKTSDDNTAYIGISEEPLKIIKELNRIVLPKEGQELAKDEQFGAIYRGKKNLFSLISPLSGEVLAVNDDIEDALDVILEDNYDEGWLAHILIQAPEELDELMTREEYHEYVTDAGELDEDDDEDEEYEGDEEDEDEDEDDDDDDYYNDRDDD